jgi:hypothetical protein
VVRVEVARFAESFFSEEEEEELSLQESIINRNASRTEYFFIAVNFGYLNIIILNNHLNEN